MTTNRFQAPAGRLALALFFVTGLGGCAALAAEPEPRLAAANDVAVAEGSGSGEPVAPRGRVSGEGFGAFLAARQARIDGDTAAAAHFYNRALEADPENPWLLHRAFLLSVTEGLVGDALPLAHRVLNDDEASPIASLTIAVDDIKHGRFAAAEARLKDVGDAGSMRLVGPLLAAWAAYGAGEGAAAAGRLDTLDQTEAFSIFSDYHRALILAAAGNYDGSLAAFAELPDAARADIRSSLVRAAIIARRDGSEAARPVLEDLRTLHGDDEALLDYLEGRRNPADAFPVRDAADGAAEALFGAASALARDSVNDVSMIYLRLALHLRPGLDVAQALLGDMREAASRWVEAIDAYERVDSDSPYKWSARLRIAWALNKLDRTDQAIELLRRMAAERESETSALVTLADVLRGQSRFAEAAIVYGEAIDRIGAITPDHWSLFYARGIALERAGRWQEAEASLTRSLELKPQQPLVMNYLGYSWVDQGVKLDQALKMIREAVELRPADGYIVDSLGWALYRKGDYPGAVEQLERAVELRPEDPTINDHLGDAYWQVGRRLESCYQWKRALTLDAEEDQVGKIEAKLDGGLNPGADRFRGCR